MLHQFYIMKRRNILKGAIALMATIAQPLAAKLKVVDPHRKPTVEEQVRNQLICRGSFQLLSPNEYDGNIRYNYSLYLTPEGMFAAHVHMAGSGMYGIWGKITNHEAPSTELHALARKLNPDGSR